MKHLLCWFMIIMIGLSSVPVPAFAQQGSDIPLMVIRYNQTRVYYDRQLYSAASKAINIKPSVLFSVVSFVPQNGSKRRQKLMHEQSDAQTGQLVADMKRMGIPADQIKVTREFVGDGRYHEIYIYVD